MASLDAALAELLARTGAQAAMVVDGRTGTVVAEVGVPAGEDGATLVALARDAVPAAAAEGDLVVATRDAVHVLRVADVPGTFLHVRLAPGHGDVAAIRRELASPALQAIVANTLPRPRATLPGPRPPRQDADRQPALATLVTAGPPPIRSGVLAALALGPAGIPHPAPRQHRAAPVPIFAVLYQPWSCDPSTLRRVAAGLRSLE